jgi:transmembrane sensor
MLLATMIGEIREVPLPDGSKVTLDTNAKLSAGFDGKERRLVLERGRARFFVADDKRPFKVRAGNTEVVVARSTVFDVHRDAAETVVLLVEGSVDIVARSMAHASQSAEFRRLQPGEKLSISASVDESTVLSPTAGDISWPSGMLRFENVALGEVVAQANRYSRSPIQVVDSRIRPLRVTGAYRAGDNEALARSLAAIFDLQLLRGAGGGYLLSASPSSTR